MRDMRISRTEKSRHKYCKNEASQSTKWEMSQSTNKLRHKLRFLRESLTCSLDLDLDLDFVFQVDFEANIYSVLRYALRYSSPLGVFIGNKIVLE